MDGIRWMEFCADSDLPFVAIVHCNSEMSWPDDELGAKMARAYKSAKAVFCVSRANLKLLERQLGTLLSNASVVWNPYNVSPDQAVAWPKENGVWKMACVARLQPAAKGQDLLFEVMARKHWQDRPVEINLFGNGPHTDNLRKIAGNLGVKNVHFRGHVNDVKEIWLHNHLLVLPSRYEGLPLALVEAMWCARPAVVTDIGGNAEVCADGETGFVADAPTVKLLDQTLERAWMRRNEWHTMGQAARARAEQLVPRDPIGNFCERLQECVKTKESNRIRTADDHLDCEN
jgi:glycosyltransferase involved in cell wall biosynthesis